MDIIKWNDVRAAETYLRKSWRYRPSKVGVIVGVARGGATLEHQSTGRSLDVDVILRIWFHCYVEENNLFS